MFSKSYWKKGYYLDNHVKYNCFECSKDFIIGKRLLEGCSSGYPICPYCGSRYIEAIVETDEDQLEEIADCMGCLGIYVDEE